MMKRMLALTLALLLALSCLTACGSKPEEPAETPAAEEPAAEEPAAEEPAVPEIPEERDVPEIPEEAAALPYLLPAWTALRKIRENRSRNRIIVRIISMIRIRTMISRRRCPSAEQRRR